MQLDEYRELKMHSKLSDFNDKLNVLLTMSNLKIIQKGQPYNFGCP